MTTTLTLAPDATTASVLITATTDAAGLTITRTDQNGVASVRLLAGQQLGQAVAIRDYEPALVGPVRYTCTTTNPVELRRNYAEAPLNGAVPVNTTFVGYSRMVPSVGNDGWIAWTVTDDNAGSQARRIEQSRTPSHGRGLSVSPGDNVTLSIELAAGAGWRRRTRAGIYWLDAAGGIVGSLFMPVTTLTAEGQRYTVSASAPANAVKGTWTVVDNDGAVSIGDVLLARRVLFARSDGAFFDGSTPGAEWTGAVNASASVIRAIEAVERIVRFDEGAHEVTADVWSVVERPQYGARGRLTLAQSLSAEDRSTRHDIIGRPDPVFIMQRGGFRTGTVELLCLDVAAVDAFYQLQGQAGIVQVRTAALSPGQRLLGDLYVKVTGISSDTVDGGSQWRFRVRLQVAEVRRPTGPLLGAAVWTYDALPSSEMGLTYEGLPREFATYNDLAAGVRIDG